jgi:hypothetical protein
VKKFALIVMIVALLAAPTSAFASNGYPNVAGVAGGGNSGTSTPSAVASAGESSGSGVLPFTGLELGLMFGASVVLLGTGLALRRARAGNR